MRLPGLLLAIFPAICVFAAPPDGAALYKARCAACHDGAPQGRMPGRSELAAKTPEFIFDAMFHGAMTQQAAGLSQEEGRAGAAIFAGRWRLERMGHRSRQLALSAPSRPFGLRCSEA